MARIAVAVSGGVDSLASLLVLKKAGHEVIALHGLFLPDAAPPEGLAGVCRAAGADLQIIDLRRPFLQEVLGCYATSSGFTPNPCAICNRKIKFGALLDAALALGCDKMATGHYCRLDENAFILPASDSRKDQGYFLGLVDHDRLKFACFPLYGWTKSHTRSFVEECGFVPPLARESQDTCFSRPVVEDGEGPVYLREEGELIRIGTHCGVGRYTVGQRRGLHLPWREPLYVQEITGNSLVVAPRRLMNMSCCEAGDVNLFVPFSDWPEPVYGRFRYRQDLVPVRIENNGEKLKIWLLEPRFASAPGQLAALYDNCGRLLAGGIVERVAFTAPDLQG